MMIEPTSGYALKAQEAAKKHSLGFRVYSYSGILGTVPEGEDFIRACCQATNTNHEEQLKFALASDITIGKGEYGHPVIAVVRYCDRFDFKKIAKTLVDKGVYPIVKERKLSPSRANPKVLDIEPGYLGINQNACYPVTDVDLFQQDRRSYAKVPYMFDSLIKNLQTICFPTGKGKANELVVVSSDQPLGDRLGSFLEDFIGEESFTFGDIRK